MDENDGWISRTPLQKKSHDHVFQQQNKKHRGGGTGGRQTITKNPQDVISAVVKLSRVEKEADGGVLKDRR